MDSCKSLSIQLTSRQLWSLPVETKIFSNENDMLPQYIVKRPSIAWNDSMHDEN